MASATNNHHSWRPILAVSIAAMRTTRARGSSLGNKDASRTLIRPGYATARPWSNASSVFLTTDSEVSMFLSDMLAEVPSKKLVAVGPVDTFAGELAMYCL